MSATISVSGGTVNEGGFLYIDYVVTLSEVSNQQVTVDYRTIGGTTNESADYRGATNTLTFAPGETSKTVRVEVFGDSTDEADEAVVLELYDPVNATLSGNSATLRETGFILDNDGTASNLALFVSSPVIVENDSGQRMAVFSVDLSQPAPSSLSFAFTTQDGSALAGQDYQSVSGTVDFLSGQTTQTVSVPIFGDATVESSEFFHLVVTPTADIANGADGAVGTATILDDDAGNGVPTLSVEGHSMNEGGFRDLRYVVTLSEVSNQQVTVDYRTIGGTTNESADYRGATNTLTFAPGETSKTISVEIFGDSTDEADEAVVLELVEPVNAALAGGVSVLRETAFIYDNDGAGPNLALFVTDPVIVEGDNGTREALFELELSRPPANAITLNYTTADGSARAGSDYTATSGSVTFAAGQTRAAVSVEVSGDMSFESSEFFHLVVTPTADIANGADGAVGTATILDDDAGNGVPTLSVEGHSMNEGGFRDLRYVVTLSEVSNQQVTVDYRTIGGTTNESADYRGATNTLTFAPGETSKTISVEIFGDSTDEADEAVVLELVEPVNAALAGGVSVLRETAFIYDNDGAGPNLALFVTDPVIVEGDNGTREALFELELSRPPANAITLNYTTADGSARAGSDYTATSGSVTFAAGQTRAAVSVEVSGDMSFESSEFFHLVVTPTADIANGADGAVGTATILDDDAGNGVPTLSVEGHSMNEGGFRDLRYVVTLSEVSNQQVTVDYRTIGGTTNESADYRGATNTLTFAPGETSKTISVEIFGDSTDEADEAVVLELVEPVNAALAGGVSVLRETAFIYDNDGAGPNLALFVTDPVIVEGDNGTREALFELELSRPPANAITLNYTTADGSARAGSDYTATSGSVTFAAGQTRAAVSVEVSGDMSFESSEFFHLVVTPTADIANGADGAVGTATILDDDAGNGVPTLSVEGHSMNEGGFRDLRYVVTLSEVSNQQVTVDYRTIGGTTNESADYRGATNTLTFAPGETSKTISVEIFGDSTDEADEAVVLELTNPTGAVLAGHVNAITETAFIYDNDGTGTDLSVFISSPTLRESGDGDGFAVFEVELSRPVSSAITLNYSTGDGTATAGSDYVAQSGSLTFEPGQTRAVVKVPLLQDITVEADETFNLSIQQPLPGIFSNIAVVPIGTATLTDDDLVADNLDNVFFGTQNSDGIAGLGGNDRLVGGRGNDVLDGGSGDDTLEGEANNDTLVGGSGNDTINGGQGDDLLAGGFDDDVYIFNAGDGQDRIVDDGGRDWLAFGAGLQVDDLFLAVNPSLDIVAGFYNRPGDTITMTSAVTTPSARTDLLQFQDGVILDLGGIVGGDNFSDAADVINGRGASDFYNTRGGDDVIDAGEGNDIVVAGNGNDTITGGQGIDNLMGGLGDDTYRFSLGDGTDRIVDQGGRDWLEFGAGAQVDDLIMVVRGEDLLVSFFGFGSDVIEMIDAVTTPSARTDLLRFADGTVLDLGGIVGGQNFDDARNEINGRSASDFTNARGGNDAILGNAGNDIINGGNGDDDIDGGFGLDVLIGGNGADDFIFSIAPNANDADLILDFQTGQDRLLLSSSQFGLPQGALAAGALAFGSAAQDANDRLIYDASTQRLLFDADGTGGAAAIKIAELNGGVALAESDIFIY